MESTDRWVSAACGLGRRVLVTGASGCVGRAVCRALLEAGAEVHGTYRTRPPPDGIAAHLASLPGDIDALLDASCPEVVLHLASPVDVTRDPAAFPALRAGVLDATDAVARAALARSLRLVVTGTCEEYGDGEAPFSEAQLPRPVSAYSALKAAATGWVMTLTRTAGLQATVVRPFRAYGPHDHGSVVAQACRAALAGARFPTTDGAQVREWNHVDAIAAGVIAAAAHPDAVGRVLNLGGGEQASVRAVVEAIFRLAGADPALVDAGALPRRAGEVDRFWGDHRTAEALWGRLPNPSLEDGLRDTLDWWALEGEL